jgi:hypothetical protein
MAAQAAIHDQSQESFIPAAAAEQRAPKRETNVAWVAACAATTKPGAISDLFPQACRLKPATARIRIDIGLPAKAVTHMPYPVGL